MAFRIRPSRPFTSEFRSVARQQLEKAIAVLSDQPDGPHVAIHAARKRFKRLRALYRLIRLDTPEFRHQENTRIRDMARTLSSVRDATALVETVDYLASQASSAEELAALSHASSALSARRDRIVETELDLDRKMAQAIATCEEALAALDRLALDDDRKASARRIGKVWVKQQKSAQLALMHCLSGHDAESFHDLRKRTQVYWMHLSLIRDIWPPAIDGMKSQAKALVDVLGHEHDLSVLTQTVNEDPMDFGDSDTLALLIAAIIARQQALRAEALERAHLVFGEQAKAEGRTVEILWRQAV